MRSAAFGIYITWLIAFVLAIVAAYASAWPLALFTGGNPRFGWVVGFVLGGCASGAWALRTSMSLLADERRRADTFRAPWPTHASIDGLVALELLDRRRQPGRRSTMADDLLADLRGGERSEKALVVERTAMLHLVVDGAHDGSASIIDAQGRERASTTCGDATRRARLEQGTYRLVIARSGPDERHRTTVHAWWIASEPGDMA